MKKTKKRKRERRAAAREEDTFWAEVQWEAERIFEELTGGEDGAPQGTDHKGHQLCAQARDALELALAASADAVLRDLRVENVTLLRGGSCLEVAVRPVGDARELWWIGTRLRRARGYLRGEIAASIHRKRTPELAFVVLPLDEEVDHGPDVGGEVSDDDR